MRPAGSNPQPSAIRNSPTESKSSYTSPQNVFLFVTPCYSFPATYRLLFQCSTIFGSRARSPSSFFESYEFWWNNPRLLGKQPSERDLSRRRLLRFCDLAKQINQGLIRLPSPRRKAREFSKTPLTAGIAEKRWANRHKRPKPTRETRPTTHRA
jgi:hypothetical protein